MMALFESLGEPSMRILALLVLALALTACTPEGESPTSSTSNSQATAIPRDEQSCRVAGGTWRPVCLRGELTCVVKYADAGKTCRDGDECQSHQCRYTGEAQVQPGTKVTGTCHATNDPCGCFTLVENGEVTHTLCAD
jgi:hypothetical protein